MENQFSRTELVIGKEAVEKLKNSKVVVFGVGGVGSYVVEGLARAGIGSFVIIDNDEVSVSNINRQLIATYKTVGIAKVDVVKERILDINPDAKVEVFKEFVTKESRDYFDSNVSYVVDAIDTVTAKLDLIERANKLNVPVIAPTKYLWANPNGTHYVAGGRVNSKGKLEPIVSDVGEFKTFYPKRRKK